VEPEFVQAGRLLVANPLLPDPNFDRTVVFLIAYNDDDGAVGIVLNRPTDTTVAATLPRWVHMAASPAVIFVGGPVQDDAVICLARPFGHPAAAAPPGEWKPVTSDIGRLDLDLDPDSLQSSLSQVRLFAGYAGWAPGQLEAEIAAGAWWVVDAEPDDAFCDDPEQLWKTVLRRERGPLALVASYPDDPAWN
jgi:putative transcriptional regulator